MAQSDLAGQVIKNVALLALSLTLLPLDSAILLLAWISNYVFPSTVRRRRQAATHDPAFRQKTILVTGVGMSKGLTLARILYAAGHRVIGADFEPDGALVCGRGSASLSKFFTLRTPGGQNGSGPYVQSMLDIITKENVDLWVSCSGVASAVEDGEVKEIIEARTSCRAIQFDAPTTQMLHEKHSFITRAKEIGLTVPDTHEVTNLRAVQDALRKAPEGRKYILKPIGMDDANRGDMTLLPKGTWEATMDHLSHLRVSEKHPWILQQFIDGPEYCTHSLVVAGQVKAFVACPSAELLMHYEALPPDNALSRGMLEFTERFAAAEGKKFTGHLSFDFMLDAMQVDKNHTLRKGTTPVLYPIECNPRAHTAVVLFAETPGFADSYLSAVERPPSNGIRTSGSADIVVPRKPFKYFWIGHDLVELLVLIARLVSLQSTRIGLADTFQGLWGFMDKLIFWHDGTFERWDPLPWWMLYHVYWPLRFLSCLRNGKDWSRLNVSTTKMFAC